MHFMTLIYGMCIAVAPQNNEVEFTRCVNHFTLCYLHQDKSSATPSHKQKNIRILRKCRVIDLEAEK
jgi:hypothetical protein